MSAIDAIAAAGGHDDQARRVAKRSQRERGCWTYISAATLVSAGIDPNGPPPLYRTWGGRRGSVLVRLYKPSAKGDT